MLDDDDLDFAILATPSGGSGPAGCIVTLLGLVLVIIIACVVASNKDECSKRHCPDGQKPKLMKSECLCVTEAKP